MDKTELVDGVPVTQAIKIDNPNHALLYDGDKPVTTFTRLLDECIEANKEV